MNFRAILVSGAIAIAVYFVANPTTPLGRVVGYMGEREAMGFGFAAFIVPALWLKPPSFRRDRFQRAAVLS